MVDIFYMTNTILNSFIQRRKSASKPFKNYKEVCKGPGPCKIAYVKGDKTVVRKVVHLP